MKETHEGWECDICNKHKATYICKKCGKEVCGYCAAKEDYLCNGFHEPPKFEKVNEGVK